MSLMREFDLLQHIFESNDTLPEHVVIPPGNDMGAITVGDRQVLVTVDQLADEVHVDLAATPIEKVGRKAITRGLSDVAAMAAKPIGAVAAGSLPRDFGRDRADVATDPEIARGTGRQAIFFGAHVGCSQLSSWLFRCSDMGANAITCNAAARCRSRTWSSVRGSTDLVAQAGADHQRVGVVVPISVA